MSIGVRLREQRRSHRVQIAVTVILRGKRGDRAFEEETTTTVVNSAAGLALSSAGLQTDERITATNKKTAEEMACKVVFVGVGGANRPYSGFEFLDSFERKRPVEKPRAASSAAPAKAVPTRK
jgi:hypothetical protein